MNIRLARILSVFIIVFLSSKSGFGQITYHISNYPVSFMKGGNQNWDLDQDSKQRLYVANNYGLVKLENTSASIYYLPEQTIVRSVHVIGNRVYTGSFEEFGYWEELQDGDFTYTSLSKLLDIPMNPNDEIWKIAEHSGMVYFHSFGSMYVYDYKTVKRLPFSHNGFMFIYSVGENLLTKKIGGSLYLIIDHQLIELPNSLIKPKEELKGVALFNPNTVIAGTTDGLYKINLEQKTITRWNVENQNELIANEINGIAKVGNYVAVGTILNGLYLFTEDGRLLSSINSTTQLQNNTVLSMLPDSLGNLWIGLDKGLAYIAFDIPIDNYRSSDLNIGSVYAAAQIDNQLHIGTNQGVYQFEYNENGKYESPKLVPESQGQVWFLSEIDHHLYAGLNSGTYRIEQNRLEKISGIQGAYNLKSIPNKENLLIQSTYNEIVIYENNPKSKLWNQSYTLENFSMPARFLEVDHQGSIWLGHTIKGVYQIIPSIDYKRIATITKIGSEHELNYSTNKVFKVDNRILVSAGDSLFQWDSIHQKFEPYKLLQPLFSEKGTVFNIIDTGNYRYWIVKKDEILLAEIHFNNVTLLYRILPKQYDFHLVEGYETIVPISNQKHVICLDDGFAVIDLSMISRKETTFPTISIQSVKRYNAGQLKEMITPEIGKKLSFSDEANSIQLNWKTSLPVGAYRFFQYKLVGFDDNWSIWTPQTEMRYDRLNSGSYTFQIRTLNDIGLISSPISFQFEIKSPWYINTLGFVLYGIIFIFSILFIRLVLARRRWKKAEVELAHEKEKIQIEKELAEKALIAVRNEKLQSEIEHKSSQLAANTMSIVRKNELLQSIKKEMENQKTELGDRFPKKYYQRVMRLIDRNLQDEQEWEAFEYLYDQANGDFFKRLKNDYPELTPSDLRLCAYLRMNLSTKEIAPLLNISIRGVEERRYRLRKRMNLTSDLNLNEIIMTY